MKLRLASLFILSALITLPVTVVIIMKSTKYAEDVKSSAVSASATPLLQATDTPSPATCTRMKPTLSVTPITQNASAGQTVTYNIFFQDMDADCPPTTFTFSTKGLGVGWDAQITPSQVKFTNGSSMNTTVVVTSSPDAPVNTYPIDLSVSSNYPIHYQNVTLSYQVQ